MSYGPLVILAYFMDNINSSNMTFGIISSTLLQTKYLHEYYLVLVNFKFQVIPSDSK